jgi:hypothetical protein
MNVAGLFFSNKKCPIHANPYPQIGANRKYFACEVKIAINKQIIDKVVPIK